VHTKGPDEAQGSEQSKEIGMVSDVGVFLS